jgi:hypothetical protein
MVKFHPTYWHFEICFVCVEGKTESRADVESYGMLLVVCVCVYSQLLSIFLNEKKNEMKMLFPPFLGT